MDNQHVIQYFVRQTSTALEVLVPGILNATWCEQIFLYTKSDVCTTILSLIYFERFIKHHDEKTAEIFLKEDECFWYFVWINCLFFASTWVNDNPMTMTALCHVICSIDGSDDTHGRLEGRSKGLSFLVLDSIPGLHVSSCVLERYFLELQKIGNEPLLGRPVSLSTLIFLVPRLKKWMTRSLANE